MDENIKKEGKEYLLQEAKIIQDIIKRMASNSFMIKGWTITLVVVTLLLKGENSHQAVLAFIPLFVFWFLDAYFLWQERLYWKLYNWVIKNRLETEADLLDMNASRFEGEVPSMARTMFSVTLASFYGAITLAVLIYIIAIILLV